MQWLTPSSKSCQGLFQEEWDFRWYLCLPIVSKLWGAVLLIQYFFKRTNIYWPPQASSRRRQWHPTPYTSLRTLAWKIPWMEEPGRLQSTGSPRVGHNWATSLSLFTFMHWRRKWQPTPVFLPGESQGWGSLVGCRLWDCRVGHDWSDLATAAS